MPRYFTTQDQQYMLEALRLAETAFELGETPVGAIIISDGEIIGAGYNRVETDHDPTAHAEIIAVRAACRYKKSRLLPGAVLYVTLEPCIMCAGALIHAGLAKVVYGAPDRRWGGFGTLFDLAHDPRLNREIEVVHGLLEKKSAELLRRFFSGLRRNGRP